MRRGPQGIVALSIFCCIVCASCTQRELVNLRGFTQGTTYNILYEKPVQKKTEGAVSDSLRVILKKVDELFSLYNEASLLSQLNRNKTHQVSDRLFLELFSRSREIWEFSQGRFDITVAPLVNAWGFGPDALMKFEERKRDSLMELVGMQKVIVDNGRLVKLEKGIQLDMNAIAQGFTVDLIAAMLEGMGVRHYLVEVGGEVRSQGTKTGNTKWRIGVDRPEEHNMTPGADLQIILGLSGESLATSGNYRKFFVEDGVKYVHTIDPRTGSPVRHSLLSATVIARDCTTADGFATACMVAGLEEAREMIEAHHGLEAYLIYADEKGAFRTWQSAGFEKYVIEYLYPSEEPAQ